MQASMSTGRRSPQSGGALVVVLGIIAALVVLSSAMVTLLGNTVRDTSRDQRRTKAFAVAEAALEVTMQRLAVDWPKAAPYTWAGADKASFESRFSARDFPRAPSGRFVDVWVFDDVDTATSAPGWEQAAPAWDKNGNGYLYVDAQAYVGTTGARVRAKVQSVTFELNLARGFAVWTGGTLTATGAGNNPNITAEDFAPGAYSCVAYAQSGFVNAQSLCAGYVVMQDGRSDPSDAPIQPAAIDELIAIAKVQGQYYSKDTSPSVLSLDLNNYAPPAGLVILDFRGLVGGFSVRVEPGTYNMASDEDWSNPGALLVLGADLYFGGKVRFCGLVYVDGSIGDRAGKDSAGKDSAAKGTPIIYGMMVSTGSFLLSGTAEIHYVDEALVRLDSRWQTSTRLTGGGWRELAPRTEP